MNDMSIPILSKDKIYLITKCVEEAFEYRNERKTGGWRMDFG